MRWRALLRRRVRQWILPAVGGIAVIVAAAMHRNTQLDRLAQRSEAVEQRCAPLRELQTKLIALEARRKELVPPPLLEAAIQRRVLPETIFAAIVASSHRAEAIQLRQCGLVDRKPLRQPNGADAASAAALDHLDVSLLGYAADERALAALMTNLRSAPGSNAVKLKSLHEVEIAGQKRKEFQIQYEARN
jgi:hypothetical protein